MLFNTTYYSGLLPDSSVMMNRRSDDGRVRFNFPDDGRPKSVIARSVSSAGEAKTQDILSPSLGGFEGS